MLNASPSGRLNPPINKLVDWFCQMAISDNPRLPPPQSQNFPGRSFLTKVYADQWYVMLSPNYVLWAISPFLLCNKCYMTVWSKLIWDYYKFVSPHYLLPVPKYGVFYSQQNWTQYRTLNTRHPLALHHMWMTGNQDFGWEKLQNCNSNLRPDEELLNDLTTVPSISQFSCDSHDFHQDHGILQMYS